MLKHKILKFKYLLLGFVLAVLLEPNIKLNQCYVQKDGLQFYNRIKPINWQGEEVTLYGRNLHYSSWLEYLYYVTTGIKECEPK